MVMLTRPVTPCVLYQTIHRTQQAWGASVVASVKCDAGRDDATACANFTDALRNADAISTYKHDTAALSRPLKLEELQWRCNQE